VEKYVSQQQGSITDSLVSVIQFIQKDGRTGELRVGRGEGVNTEIGSIVFNNGQVVSAQLGAYTGPAALNILMTWGRCVFIFSPVTSPGIPLQSSPALDRRVPPQSSPALDRRVPPQSSPSLDRRVPLQSSPSLDRRESQPLESFPPIRRPGNSSPSLERQSGALPGMSIPLIAIPRLTMSIVKSIAAVEQAGLPRAYRRVVLLIDGRHSVNDLIISIGCTPEEMQQILQTLERITVVRIAR
jgi:Domain of unknown function (DUF4388)